MEEAGIGDEIWRATERPRMARRKYAKVTCRNVRTPATRNRHGGCSHASRSRDTRAREEREHGIERLNNWVNASIARSGVGHGFRRALHWIQIKSELMGKSEAKYSRCKYNNIDTNRSAPKEPRWEWDRAREDSGSTRLLLRPPAGSDPSVAGISELLVPDAYDTTGLVLASSATIPKLSPFRCRTVSMQSIKISDYNLRHDSPTCPWLAEQLHAWYCDFLELCTPLSRLIPDGGRALCGCYARRGWLQAARRRRGGGMQQSRAGYENVAILRTKEGGWKEAHLERIGLYEWEDRDRMKGWARQEKEIKGGEEISVLRAEGRRGGQVVGFRRRDIEATVVMYSSETVTAVLSPSHNSTRTGVNYKFGKKTTSCICMDENCWRSTNQETGNKPLKKGGGEGGTLPKRGGDRLKYSENSGNHGVI
ncbi:hypothetical protein DFH09DRAFT_1087404 [Mycena vulgaris]|nr:hypothetical protein DFH09DRAFT_1087404 [Mycena vulgaris]